MSAGIGLRKWLGALQKAAADVAVAAFDTRISRPRLPGSAAAGAQAVAAARLLECGAADELLCRGTTGPLLEGEAERARRWGEALAVELDAAGRRPRRVS